MSGKPPVLEPRRVNSSGQSTTAWTKTKKFHRVRDLGITSLADHLLEFVSNTGIERLDAATASAHNVMVMMGMNAAGELEALDSITKIALADQAGGFEGRQAAVDRHQVTTGGGEAAMDFVDCERPMVVNHHFQDLAARPGDA